MRRQRTEITHHSTRAADVACTRDAIFLVTFKAPTLVSAVIVVLSGLLRVITRLSSTVYHGTRVGGTGAWFASRVLLSQSTPSPPHTTSTLCQRMCHSTCRSIKTPCVPHFNIESFVLATPLTFAPAASPS